MKKEMQIRQAVEAIKDAVLQGQYEAAKGVTRIQLAVYFGIGKYVSQHTRRGGWGKGVLETISEQLRRELPGLRGYSATNLKNMRLFYEAWQMLDVKSSVTTDELEKSAFAIAEIASSKSSVTTSDKSAISPTASEKSVRKSAIASHKFSKQMTYLCPPICLRYQM